jgi:hypothetical protein
VWFEGFFVSRFSKATPHFPALINNGAHLPERLILPQNLDYLTYLGRQAGIDSFQVPSEGFFSLSVLSPD